MSSRTVAIHALQLHGAVGSLEIPLQVHLVAEIDRSGVGRVPRPHSGEVRMSAIKRRNAAGELRLSIRGLEVPVALSARRVVGGRQSKGALMFDMAGSAGGREGLLGLMHGRVMTGLAGRLGDLCSEAAGGDVAG